MTRTKPRTARGTSRSRGRRKDHAMTDNDREGRTFARSLFTGQPADDQERETDTTGNHVPREGGGNGQQRPTDYDDRNFAGSLFGVDENNRNLHTTNID